MENIEDHNTMLLIKIPKNKTKIIDKSFTIIEEFYKICKEYMSLRAELGANNVSNRFFFTNGGWKMFK